MEVFCSLSTLLLFNVQIYIICFHAFTFKIRIIFLKRTLVLRIIHVELNKMEYIKKREQIEIS
jgi:hypothetical protein